MPLGRTLRATARLVRRGTSGGVQARDLRGRRGAGEYAGWRDTADGRAPRLGARDYIGTGVTRLGPFENKDPLATPRLWNRWRWLGFLAWVGLLGGSVFKAYRDVGGVPGLGRDDDVE